MIQKKYKLNELAKDFGIEANEVVDLLLKLDKTPKKPTAVLADNELEYVFEHYIKSAEVKSFDEFFAIANQKQEKKAEPQKPQVITAPNPKTEGSKPVKTAEKFVAKPIVKAITPNPNINKPQDRQNQYAQANERAPKPVAKALPNQNNNKPFTPSQRPAQPQQTVTNAEKVVRHVDTKTVEVNLDKYNERYEKIAPTPTPKRNETFQRKQKINQKSQQRRKAQFSNKRETEGQKLQRLALERARKQQLKMLFQSLLQNLKLQLQMLSKSLWDLVLWQLRQKL